MENGLQFQLDTMSEEGLILEGVLALFLTTSSENAEL
jgi:hypothetical protein